MNNQGDEEIENENLNYLPADHVHHYSFSTPFI